MRGARCDIAGISPRCWLSRKPPSLRSASEGSGGDGLVTDELPQLKGQIVAIEQASIQKKCGIQFQGEPVA